jgi:hypothetical protein
MSTMSTTSTKSITSTGVNIDNICDNVELTTQPLVLSRLSPLAQVGPLGRPDEEADAPSQPDIGLPGVPAPKLLAPAPRLLAPAPKLLLAPGSTKLESSADRLGLGGLGWAIVLIVGSFAAARSTASPMSDTNIGAMGHGTAGALVLGVLQQAGGGRRILSNAFVFLLIAIPVVHVVLMLEHTQDKLEAWLEELCSHGHLHFARSMTIGAVVNAVFAAILGECTPHTRRHSPHTRRHSPLDTSAWVSETHGHPLESRTQDPSTYPTRTHAPCRQPTSRSGSGPRPSLPRASTTRTPSQSCLRPRCSSRTASAFTRRGGPRRVAWPGRPGRS